MSPDAPRPRLAVRVALGVAATALSLLGAWAVWSQLRRPPFAVTIAPGAEADTEIWNGQAFLVVDPVVGHRPRRNTVSRGHMLSLLGGTAVEVVTEINNLGLIRSEDLEGEIPGPRVLVLGDSHMMGVVSNADNATTLLENALRERPGLEQAMVLNAACGIYSIYQYYLRTRTLVERLQPQLILVVAFTGNDFLELEDPNRPRLDDDLQHVLPDPRDEFETTSKRMAALGLPAPYEDLFWQGMDQCAYLHEHPERTPVLKRKAARSIELLAALAAEHDAALMFALLPSYDRLWPDLVAGVTPYATEVINNSPHRELHDWLRDELARQGVPTVDLMPAFRADGRHELWAADFHIWRPGHALVAAELEEPVARLLTGQ